MKKLLLTGGGTAGHVTPNIAMLPLLREQGYDISYIGSYNGIEKKLITEQNVPYYGISTGKLRRYFDLKNLTVLSRAVLKRGSLSEQLSRMLYFPRAASYPSRLCLRLTGSISRSSSMNQI